MFYLKNLTEKRAMKLNLIFILLLLTIEIKVSQVSLSFLQPSDMFYYYLLAVYYAAGFYLFLPVFFSAVDPKWHFADSIF